MNSFTEENYLKIIYKLSQVNTEEVYTNAIAELSQTKPSSVSDMLKKLADKSLIDYKKYQGVKLTLQGEKLALDIIRKHRLWEVFLVEKLNFKWDEVHDIAEELEHIKHPLLINRLDEYLGHPIFDPHGDPIPNEKGEVQKTESVSLNNLKIGEEGVISGLKESSSVFLKFLNKMELKIGTKCLVHDIIAFDCSVELLINDNQKIIISKEATANILIHKKIFKND